MKTQKIKIVVGLDVSTSVVGYSLFSTTGQLIKIDYIKLTNLKSMCEKAELVKGVFEEILKAHEVVYTIIEAPLLHFSKFSNAHTLAKLTAFNAVITYLMFTLTDKEPEHINVAKARKRVCGKLDRKNAKELAFTFARANEPNIEWPVMVKGKNKGSFKKECMDMSDSYIVGRAYFYDK